MNIFGKIQEVIGKLAGLSKKDKDVTIEKNQNSEIITGGKDLTIHITTGPNTRIPIEQAPTPSKSDEPTIQKPRGKSS